MSRIISWWWKYFFTLIIHSFLFQLLSWIYPKFIVAVGYHLSLFCMTVSEGSCPPWMPFPKSFSVSVFRVIKSSLLCEEESEGEKRVQLIQMHSVLLGHKGQFIRLPALKEALTGWQRLWQSSSAKAVKNIFVLSCSDFRLGLTSHFYLEDRIVLNCRSLENCFIRGACIRSAFLYVILKRQ